MSKDRTGLYLLVIFTLLNSCSANSNSEQALKLLKGRSQQAPAQSQGD